MKRRHCAYAFNDDERGSLNVDKIPMIRIRTVLHEPWNLRGVRYPNPDEEKKVVDYLEGKMRTYVADYSSGPYASPWFRFIKPNGTLRWVQNLQRLNAVTVRDAGGLPNADALSESCAGRPIISLIDLYLGYDQFFVYPPDRPVTTMHMPRGLIHMNVAPEGWTNAVVMVQRHMIRAMQTVSPHITQPYIDDLAVKGPKEREENEVLPRVRRFVWKHIQDIDKVLGLLEEHNLTASGPKSKHYMRETMILGFVCNEKGRRPNVKKTNKILEWPVPFKSIMDVRSFLGTCGFWRSFVKDFATKTKHLRKLVLKQPGRVWPQDEEVITVGDDTPPCSPAPEPSQHSWPKGIPEPGSEEIPEFPPETIAVPEQEAEMEKQGAGEGARMEAIHDSPSVMPATERPAIEEPVLEGLPPALSSTSERMGAEAATPEGQGPQGRGTSRETREEKSARVRVRLDEIHARQAEMESARIEPTPPVDPKTSEQQIDELWARYESKRDAARQRSGAGGHGDGDELRVRELEVEHLTTQLAEERARNQAREIEWERRFREMAAIVDRLSAAWEASRTGRVGVDGQDRGMRASPSQGAAVGAPRQAGPMGEVPLDTAEEEGGAQESLMAMPTERRGSRLHELAAALGIGTPQERPQRLDTPGYTLGLGELRAELGSWDTETDSGGPDSGRQQQQDVVSEPAAVAGSQPLGSCGDVEATERPHEERPRELGTPGHESVPCENVRTLRLWSPNLEAIWGYHYATR
ncbi:hypothetical protein CBR_g20992 [Chara braunii]|uniref:Reverse transcriptase domain-containing protein n=1 Tax=Chara braunii TaxID=69332 RepID=A0A388L0C7_CHABU|nr:hypothetical protein CBR_g20992 [Chara braunii]|eukprot:GBG75745.1 hypothetical protein CBR_g20992 [Chara braunii]